MAQVNFYALGKSQDEVDGPLVAACRIAEKAVSLGHRVYVWLADETQARRLDEMMWAYRPTSFLPHDLINEQAAATGANATSQILLGTAAPTTQFGDVVINLSAQPCADPGAFTRVNEIVGPDEHSLNEGRRLYRQYQNAGLALEHFAL